MRGHGGPWGRKWGTGLNDGLEEAQVQLTQNLQKRSAGKVVNSKSMTRLYRPIVMSIIDSDPRFSNSFIFLMILVAVLLISLVHGVSLVRELLEPEAFW